MTRIIVLDTGVVSLLTHPRNKPESQDCRAWLIARLEVGDRVVLPEIADYELRREYELNGAITAIARLDALATQVEFVPLTTPAIRKAGTLWAVIRREGLATADKHALDGDVLIAAQTLLLQGPDDTLVIATTNVKHMSRLAAARLYTDIT